MRQSQLFTKTLKSVSREETAKNAQLLTRAGFIYKNSAGVYSYLPLGWRVIKKISAIIREEMNAIGGVEMFMPALVDRKYLEATDRFKLDVGFDVFSKGEKKARFALGWTHEEIITAIATRFVSSYKDLPFYIYQIQTKFRNEARAKSGLLRGIEFLMKDLYSFHASQDDLFEYYEKVREAYYKVFSRCGLEVFYTVAGGGDFTMANTHEFQVLADVGEDTIFYCSKCSYAENNEISKLKKGGHCPNCKGIIEKGSAIEVANIFPLGTKYSEALGLKFKDKEGAEHAVVMGSYGIGISRLMATIVEIYNDEDGILWPESVAPYKVHMIALAGSSKVMREADKLYKKLCDAAVDVLYDERDDMSAGEKFVEADLIGIPLRVILSEKSLAAGGVELKARDATKAKVVSIDEFLKNVKIVK